MQPPAESSSSMNSATSTGGSKVAAASSAHSPSTASVPSWARDGLRWKRSWKVYGPPAVWCVLIYGLYRAILHVNGTATSEPQFLPVYDQGGKLMGFTHPTLIEATEQMRVSNLEAKHKGENHGGGSPASKAA